MWEDTKLCLGAQLYSTISNALDPGVGESSPWAANATVAAPGKCVPLSLTVSPIQFQCQVLTTLYTLITIIAIFLWVPCLNGRWKGEFVQQRTFEICSACNCIPKLEEGGRF